MIKLLFLILITIFIPPLGVFLLTGCSADFLINILLTLLGYFPGHIHAFYLEYVYVKRRDERRQGVVDTRRAPGVYSERVQNGGRGPVVAVGGGAGVPVQQGYGGVQQGNGMVGGQQVPVQQGYGTVH